MGGIHGAKLCVHASCRSKGGGLRLPHKRREAWRRDPFTEQGRGVVFKASTPHDHRVGSGHLTRPLGSACSPRVSHAPGVANGGGGKPGRRWLGQRVGPDSLRPRWPDWSSGAAEPRPRPFISIGKGGRHPAFFYLLSPPASASSSHPPWRNGTPVPRRWRRGSPLDSTSLLLLSARWWSRPRGEGGGGEAMGEAGAEVVVLGEEEDGAARRLRPRQ